MISDFGWSDTLGQNFAPYAARGYVPARIVAQHRGAYAVTTDHGELSAQLSGRLAHAADEGGHPVVGDWVAVSARPAEGTATVHAVLPRRTVISRKMAGGNTAQILAANVDVVFVVTSMNADLNPRRLERYLATAWASGAKPVAVLTKADICQDIAAAVAIVEDIAFGVPVVPISAATGAGLDALAVHLKPGETCALVGSSGVGKSTLLNALAGAALMATGAIRARDATGRHTTTHRQLARMPNGVLILDTPGMRALGLIDADSGVAHAFEDIEALIRLCRFHDCGHTSEPGCAVRPVLETGQLDAARWRNFNKLQRELARDARRDDPLARAEVHRRRVLIAKAQRAGKKIRGKP
jgi:ribosome biogenesis GTPase